MANAKIITVSIDEQLLARLDKLCKETDRQRSWVFKKALEDLLEELDDCETALQRLNDTSDQIISSEELREKLLKD